MENKKQKVFSKKLKRKQLFDLIIIIVISVIAFIISSTHDILESIVNFSQQHEKWEVDELITVSICLVFVLSVFLFRRWFEIKKAHDELSYKNNELVIAISEIKRLRGILPICAECKRIRDDAGYWHQVELYVREHTDAEFSHSICPDCMRKLYPEFMDDKNQSVKGVKGGPI